MDVEFKSVLREICYVTLYGKRKKNKKREEKKIVVVIFYFCFVCEFVLPTTAPLKSDEPLKQLWMREVGIIGNVILIMDPPSRVDDSFLFWVNFCVDDSISRLPKYVLCFLSFVSI